jgi:hypothetical protein
MEGKRIKIKLNYSLLTLFHISSESFTEVNIKMSHPTKVHLETEVICSSEMLSFTRLHSVTPHNIVVLY